MEQINTHALHAFTSKILPAMLSLSTNMIYVHEWDRCDVLILIPKDLKFETCHTYLRVCKMLSEKEESMIFHEVEQVSEVTVPTINLRGEFRLTGVKVRYYGNNQEHQEVRNFLFCISDVICSLKRSLHYNLISLEKAEAILENYKDSMKYLVEKYQSTCSSTFPKLEVHYI